MNLGQYPDNDPRFSVFQKYFRILLVIVFIIVVLHLLGVID